MADDPADPFPAQSTLPQPFMSVFSGPQGADLRAMLAPQENVLAALQVDLSAELRFATGWVVLTPERILACDPGAAAWRAWPLSGALALRLQDHGGVGTLELQAPDARLAFCNRHGAAHHPLQGLQETIRGVRGLPGLRPDVSASAARRDRPRR